ncbi:MAG: response regulator transcription factor [Chloroflexi bacterium]|nr:response regulator transcription factor [Chloroflexota bacterium]
MLKDSVADIGGLIQAVVAVVNGQLVLDSNIVQKLARHYVNRALLDRLTSVERQVLMLLATGYEYSAIAELLDIDLRKVDGYADSIYAKLPKLSQGGHLPPRDQAILAFVNYGTSSPYEFV